MTTLTVLVGLPASGKSQKAKELAIGGNVKIHSSDSLREELYNDINFQGRNRELFDELHRRIKSDLSDGINVIYDATNLNSKKRKRFLESLNKINVRKEAIVMATPYNICIQRNASRDRQLPIEVIKRMRENFNIPIKQEGFDRIFINFSDDWDKADIFDDISGINKYNQENIHHTLTLGEHCISVRRFLENNNQDIYLQLAGLLHDVGKIYTKTFFNISDGTPSESAHFYNHENVGAYESLFLLKNTFNDIFTCICNDSSKSSWINNYAESIILRISTLINYHMRPYFLKTEKSITKFKEFVGEDDYRDIMLIHEADELSH